MRSGCKSRRHGGHAALSQESRGFIPGSVNEWFLVDLLELDPTPLATCPGPSTSVEGSPRYRARYRFNVLSRGGLRIFRVDAHWQKEARSVNPEKEGWRDCESTGAWEKGAEDGVLLRARLLSQRYRDLE